MYKILDRVDFSDGVYMRVIEAPEVAAACQPGQFIILMIHERGGIRSPIADFDRDAGTITIVVRRSARRRGTWNAGPGRLAQQLHRSAGHAERDRERGHGHLRRRRVGWRRSIPIARALKEAGNKGHLHHRRPQPEPALLGGQDGEISDGLIVTTDDGSRGRRSLVTEPLKELCEAGGIDLVSPSAQAS